jgi:hypothetical protein
LPAQTVEILPSVFAADNPPTNEAEAGNKQRPMGKRGRRVSAEDIELRKTIAELFDRDFGELNAAILSRQGLGFRG